MSCVVRPACMADLPELMAIARAAGSGLTNLPPHEQTLADKIVRTEAALAREEDAPGDDIFLMVLADSASGAVRGSCQMFSRIGGREPFYSYRLGTLTQYSRHLNRRFQAEMLTLCTDLEGSSEIGGLVLDRAERAAGLGQLLARSRYLFIAAHRARFADRIIAELRGVIDSDGNAPFWQDVGGRFFSMGFAEADAFNAIHGNQFIADLMPKHPLYTAMLTDRARAAMGQPHADGEPARQMLLAEGFAGGDYIDIFDGGPTLVAATDQLRTVARARALAVTEAGEHPAVPALIAARRLGAFRCTLGHVAIAGDTVAIDDEARACLNVAPGDSVMVAER